jgi:hypothetical protein
MGPLGQAPIGSRSPDRWVPLEALSSWPTEQFQGNEAGETSGQTSHRGHPAASSQGDFLYTRKAGLRAAACGGRPARQRHDGHRGAGLTLRPDGEPSSHRDAA